MKASLVIVGIIMLAVAMLFALLYGAGASKNLLTIPDQNQLAFYCFCSFFAALMAFILIFNAGLQIARGTAMSIKRLKTDGVYKLLDQKKENGKDKAFIVLVEPDENTLRLVNADPIDENPMYVKVSYYYIEDGKFHKRLVPFPPH